VEDFNGWEEDEPKMDKMAVFRIVWVACVLVGIVLFFGSLMF